MSTEVKNTKFITNTIKLVVAIVIYIIYKAANDTPISGIIYLAPFFVEFLEDLTVNRKELKADSKIMWVNWIIFFILIACLIMFVLVSVGTCGIAVAQTASVILAVTPAKYSFYMFFYYKD